MRHPWPVDGLWPFCVNSPGPEPSKQKAKGQTIRQPAFPRASSRGKQKGQEGKYMRHPAFPRGPPPQYYPGSTVLNFAVRMGSGDPR